MSRGLRWAGRRARRVAALWLVGLTACGEVLGPGASPEDELEPAPTARARAQAWQAQTAAHFRVPEAIVDARGVRYRLVPPGTFRMGSPASEVGRASDEGPFQATLLVPCYLQETEATWGEVRAWRPELAPPVAQAGDTEPARGLSHDEVGEFLAWVNKGDPTWYHRLPSEAEWEHACRAGSETPWHTGAAPPGSMVAGAGATGPRAVGAGEPNGLGLFDMHGNVAEWCRPWYGAYPASPAQLPTGPTRGERRVVRGGSWAGPREACRSAARAHLPPEARDPHVGWRTLVEADFGVKDFGPYRLKVRTYRGKRTSDRTEVTGVRVRLVSVPERLTARQEDRHIRWRELEDVTPLEIDMLPGRYYLQSWVSEGDRVVRGEERKFMVPDDLPEVDVEVPGS